MTYLLCHGFGFDNNYWENLIPLLDAEYEFFDEHFRISNEKSYVGIGHSLGFLKLNNSGIKFKALIGLQGFLNFCGSESEHKKILQKNLDRMIEKCKENPVRFLETFHRLCGDERKLEFKNISVEKLIHDLEMMKNSYAHCSVPIQIIGSVDDKIVENVILKDNFKNRKFIDLEYINGVNHTLGLAKPQETFARIKSFLNRFSVC